MLLGLKELRYKARPKKLYLPTLVYRRIRGDMIEVYKMLNGGYDQDAERQLSVNDNNTRNYIRNTKIRQSQSCRQPLKQLLTPAQHNLTDTEKPVIIIHKVTATLHIIIPLLKKDPYIW